METSTINILFVCITVLLLACMFLVLAFMGMVHKDMSAKRQAEAPSFLEKLGITRSKDEIPSDSKSL